MNDSPHLRQQAPRERDPERVRQDVVRDYVSVEAAAADYGVVLDADLTVDKGATARLRGETA